MNHMLISMDSLSDYLTNAKYRTKKASKLMKWGDDFKITFDAGSNLKNGDKVTFLKSRLKKAFP